MEKLEKIISVGLHISIDPGKHDYPRQLNNIRPRNIP